MYLFLVITIHRLQIKIKNSEKNKEYNERNAPIISPNELNYNVLIFKYPHIINPKRPSMVDSKKLLKNKL